MSTDKAIELPLTIAVTGDDHPPAVPFLRGMHSANSYYNVYNDVEKDGRSSTILLPKWLYIKDGNGRYLTVRDGPVYATLTFRTGDPDLDCVFEAVISGSSYRFVGSNGNYVMRYYTDPGWYSCDAGSTPSYEVINSTGNYVYLKDNYVAPRFISNELRNTGAPVAHGKIDESSQFEIVQAAIKNEITDVKYDIANGTVREVAPLVVLSTTVRNGSDAPIDHALSFSYEKWAVGTWNNTAGVEIGANTTFEAGVPFVSNAEFEISVSAPSSHEWGGEEGVRQTITSSITITVPAKTTARVTIIVRNAEIEVGFTYTQNILWPNGQSETEQKTGIYRNIDSWKVDAVLDSSEDI